MKKMLYTTLIACTAIVLFACNKKDNPSFSLNGLWVGTWKLDASPANPNNYFGLSFTSGSRLIVDFKVGNANRIDQTTYVNTDSIRFTYTDPITSDVYVNACKYNSNSSTMSGTYKNQDVIGNPTDKGTFSVTKQ